MAIGDSAEQGYRSALTIATETVYGTPATSAVSTHAIEFKSNSITQKFDEQKSEGFNSTRSYGRRFQLNQNVDGTIDMDFHPVDGIPLFLHALGAAVTTTGNSTTNSTAFTHSLTVGETLNVGSGTSLTIDARKGSTISRRYVGCRVNQMTISSEIGSPVSISYDLIGKAGTTTTAIADSAIGFSTARPFLYTDGQLQYAGTEASLTSSAAETIVGFELTVNNNLVNDNNSRAIGSNALSVLPPGMRDVSLILTMRVDTTTVYDRFTANSSGSVKLVLEGASITAAENFKLDIVLPKVFYNAGDHEVTGADTLMVEPEITAIRSGEDPTTTNADIKATLLNDVSGY
jgi:hypothetical protein|tara:strand:+ start:3138 stop:4175 length:1038 start_codon:yes stop_codon:yes gene_type:complete